MQKIFRQKESKSTMILLDSTTRAEDEIMSFVQGGSNICMQKKKKNKKPNVASLSVYFTDFYLHKTSS